MTRSPARPGLASSTMSRLELKPPVATTTTLLSTSTLSPVPTSLPTKPVTRPFSFLSSVTSVLATISPPRSRNASMRCVMRPRPLLWERVQRMTVLPSCCFMSTHLTPMRSAQK